jgi:hypothetical protein
MCQQTDLQLLLNVESFGGAEQMPMRHLPRMGFAMHGKPCVLSSPHDNGPTLDVNFLWLDFSLSLE